MSDFKTVTLSVPGDLSVERLAGAIQDFAAAAGLDLLRPDHRQPSFFLRWKYGSVPRMFAKTQRFLHPEQGSIRAWP